MEKEKKLREPWGVGRLELPEEGSAIVVEAHRRKSPGGGRRS